MTQLHEALPLRRREWYLCLAEGAAPREPGEPLRAVLATANR